MLRPLYSLPQFSHKIPETARTNTKVDSLVPNNRGNSQAGNCGKPLAPDVELEGPFDPVGEAAKARINIAPTSLLRMARNLEKA